MELPEDMDSIEPVDEEDYDLDQPILSPDEEARAKVRRDAQLPYDVPGPNLRPIPPAGAKKNTNIIIDAIEGLLRSFGGN